MELLVVLPVAAGVLSVFLLIAREHRQSQRRVWHEAAAQAKLAGVESWDGGMFVAPGIEGRAGSLRVRLERYRRGRQESGTRIVVEGLGHGDGGLSLRREGFSTLVEKRVFGESEIEIGDPAFDAEYLVQGRTAVALAVLAPEARRRLAGLLRGQVCLRGSLPVDVSASSGRSRVSSPSRRPRRAN